MSSSCWGVVTSLPCAAAWLAIDSRVGLFTSPWLGKLRIFRLLWLYAGLLSLNTGCCWCFWYVFLYGWKRLGSCSTVLIVVGTTPTAPFPVTTSRTWIFILNFGIHDIDICGRRLSCKNNLMRKMRIWVAPGCSPAQSPPLCPLYPASRHPSSSQSFELKLKIDFDGRDRFAKSCAP